MSLIPRSLRGMPRKSQGIVAAFLVTALVGATFGVTQLVAVAGEGDNSPTVENTALPAPVSTAASSGTVSIVPSANPAFFSSTTGGTSTVTVSLSNSSDTSSSTVNSVTVSYPSALSYVPGSAKLSGAAVADPSFSTAGSVTELSYTSPVTIPAAEGSSPGVETFSFVVTKQPGTSGVFSVDVVTATPSGLVGPASTQIGAVAPPLVLPVTGEVGKNGSLTLSPNATADAGASINGSALCLVVNDACGAAQSVSGGVYSVDSASGKIVFIAESDYTGNTSARYRAYDNFGQYAEATVSVKVVAGLAVAQMTTQAAPAYGNSPVDSSVNITPQYSLATGTTLTELCVSSDSGAVTCGASANLTHGVLNYAASTITYTPELAWVGVETGYFKITDSNGGTSIATITLTTSSDIVASPVIATTGNGVSVDISPNAKPALGETLDTSVTCVSTESLATTCSSTVTLPHGTLSYDSGTEKISYVSTDTAFAGTEVGYYKVTDTGGNTAIASVTVTVVAAPTTVNISGTNGKGMNVVLTPDATAATGYSIDPALTCVLDSVSDPTCTTTAVIADKGTFSYNSGTQKITFTPLNNTVVGPVDAFYRVTDELGTNSVVSASTSKVTATMIDGPTAPPITGSVVVLQSVELTVSATAATGATLNTPLTCLYLNPGDPCTPGQSIIDPGKGTFSYSSVTNKITFTALSTGGVNGVVRYQVTDNFGNTANNTATVTISPASTPPTVTAISPTSGPAAGGTTVTITGTGFLTGATVTIGGAAATNVVVTPAVSPSTVSTITATTPPGTVGAANVVVTNPSGGGSGTLTAGFTYSSVTVTTISPNAGSTIGGTTVTITGTGFLTGATVTIGGAAATNVVVTPAVSPSTVSTITATTPPGTVGAANVVVTNPSGGGSGTLTAGFTYVVPPTITSISPTSGPAAGGATVTITGTGFLTGATVFFGTAPATNVVVTPAVAPSTVSTITATTPPGTVSVIPVVVKVTNTNGGVGTLTSGYTYTSGTGSGTAANTVTVPSTIQPGGVVNFPICPTGGGTASPTPSATQPGTSTSGVTVGPCLGDLLTDVNSVQLSFTSADPSGTWVSTSQTTPTGTWNPRPSQQGILLTFTAASTTGSTTTITPSSPTGGAAGAGTGTTTVIPAEISATPSPGSVRNVQSKNVRAGEVTATAFVRMRPTGGTTYTYYTVAVPVVDTATPSPSTTPIVPVPTGVPTLNPDGTTTGANGTGPATNGTLPSTGGDILVPAALGLLLIIGGGAFTIVWFTRRRKTA